MSRERAPRAAALTTSASLDPDEVRRCTEVLEAILREPGLLAELPQDVRRSLLTAAGRVSRPDSYQRRRLVKALRRARRRQQEAEDRESRGGAGIRVARDAPVFVAPAPALAPPESAREQPPRRLHKPKTCYVCKQEFTLLHHFYDALCAECADFNYAKRFQSAPLGGRIGLVTGARIKIGFQTALKMLRAGARVIATTRFPRDAALRYSREPDFADWKERLQVHGLDLRHAPSVELFARHVSGAFERLDILVNNACQTVRRPPQFYAHLLENEARPGSDFGPEIRRLLEGHERICAALVPSSPQGGAHGVGIVASAALSRLDYVLGETTAASELFPEGRTDADLQQVDLRRQNSWRLALADVATAELLEVQLVNSIAPFILCARLKPLMLRQSSRDKHIVNVSAMEGVFSRGTKTDKHPHTNMAKAALNMMTLTASRDYLNDGIHMNAVDTGWVTDEDPALFADRKRLELDFQPPLDVIDGAARVCDPFFSGLLSGVHAYGKFLKDYKPASW